MNYRLHKKQWVVSSADVEDWRSSLIAIYGDRPWMRDAEERKALRLLENLEAVCKSLVKTKGLIFHSKDDQQLTYCESGELLLNVLKTEILGRVDEIFSACRLNPLLKMSLDAIATADAWILVRNLKVYREARRMGGVAAALNQLVDAIRKGMNSKELKEIVTYYQRGSRKNKKGLSRLVDGLFCRYAKVLVVRLDLSYKKSTSMSMEQQNIDHEDVKQDLETLLRDLKRKLFEKNLISYVWKLEYGLVKGYHYHTFFFFDGSKVRQDMNCAKRIGEHWSTVVTKGRGAYFNCNAVKVNYSDLGIGMVDHRDVRTRDNLLNRALKYLVKADYYVKPMAGDANSRARIRTFGRGAIPKPLTTPRGRPRSGSSAQLRSQAGNQH